MGCDGGTIPTRDELVRVKKKPEQKDRDSERVFRWKHCAISQERLQPPIVACELGGLFSKESVIEMLLDHSKFPGSLRFDHIRGLKDVKSLELTLNPAYRDAEGDKGGVYIDRNTAQYICPITGLEMSGKYRFCYLHGCGCVFAERALKEIKTETCTKCGASFVRNDVILLNGTQEEVEDLQRRMEDRRTRAKLEKKSKKKRKADSEVTSGSGSGSGDNAEGASTSKQSRVEDCDEQVNGSVTAKAKTSTDIQAGKGASSKLTNGASTSKGAISKLSNGSTALKSIQKDPKASKVYKSLFTTCDKAKNQPKGHWVTHNPQYY